MKRSALFAAVALLALAACASDKNSDSGAKSTTSTKSATPTTSLKTKKNSAKAVATAKRLGCTTTKLNKVGGGLGLPKTIGSVSCTAKGVRYRVDVYANHAERLRLLSATATRIRCGLLKALGGKGPVYTVDGDDFSATATGPPGSTDALAQATALGAKLKLPVTTTKCPA